MKTKILDLASMLWQDIINLIHAFDRHDKSIIKQSKELRNQGILRIDNFLDPAICDSIYNEIKALSKQNPRTVELDNGVKLNYRNQDNPLGPDHGMLDIFRVENSISLIDTIDQSKIVNLLESACGQKIIPLRANAYLNVGISNTRFYHVDNTQPVIYKAFVYLTDVPDLTFGPYSFIKKSHRFSFFVYFNLVRNLFIGKNRSTDMPSYNKSQTMHCTGAKGSLILSNQNAIHCGLPQQENKTRCALVFSYMVQSKLSYMHKSAQENLRNATKQ